MKKLRIKLRKFQHEGLDFVTRHNGRALIGDEMGLGKTIQSIAWWAKYSQQASPLIVICPASVKPNWKREIYKVTGQSCIVLMGRPARRRQKIELNGRQIVVVNYDILHAWAPSLKALNPRCVIFDEAQYVKNRGAQRSMATKAVARKAKYCIGLTGTPLSSRPAELWNILNIIKPQEWGEWLPYAMRYCGPQKTPWGWTYRGATRVKELRARLLKSCMIRRLKSQVLRQLPAKQRHTIVLEMKGRKEYEAAERDLVAWLHKTNAAKAKKARKAQHLTRISYLRKMVAEKKLDAVIEWIEAFLEGGQSKLVVFAIHKDIVNALHKHFQKCSVKVYGEITGHKRQVAIDLFNQDNQIRLLFGNIQAAGVGLTLVSAADVAFVELPWTPADVQQAEDRVHRIGQTRGVNCWFLVTEDTIEHDLCRSIQRKQKIVTSILAGRGMSTEDNTFDYLTTTIERRANSAQSKKTKTVRRKQKQS